MASERVLIVEDEFLIRMTLSEALADEGFEVLEAASGEEALQLLQDGPAFSLLLTDVQLRGTIDGVALAGRLRNAMPDLPVIFMTGRPDSIAAAMLSDRQIAISKPYLLTDVCAAARRLIGS